MSSLRATLILRSILLGSVWSVSAIPPELVNKYGEDGRMRTRGYFNQFGQPINAMYGAGNNEFSQLGVLDRKMHPQGVRVEMCDYIPGAAIACTQVENVSQGVGADTFSFGIIADRLLAWGDNRYGQLSMSDKFIREAPSSIPQLYQQKVLSVASSKTAVRTGHTLLLSQTNTVWAWGYNGEGQLGQGDKYTHYETSDALLVEKFMVFNDLTVNDPPILMMKVAAGGLHSLALDQRGRLHVWGDNTRGQLGIPGSEKRRTVREPEQLVHLEGEYFIVDMAAGLYHSIALTDTFQVLVWGDNSEHQLGEFTGMRSYSPIKSSLKGAKMIAAGFFHNVIVNMNNEIVTWGSNSKGQLGLGRDVTFATEPTVLEDVPTVSHLACGAYHTIVLDDGVIDISNATVSRLRKGTLYGWGDNSRGQLATGDYHPKFTPAILDAMKYKRFVSLAAGAFHNFYVADVRRCPNDCSNRVDSNGTWIVRGTCSTENGTCVCYPPWTQKADCSQGACPEDCNGRGWCRRTDAKCMCNYPYFGESCRLVKCPNDCIDDDHGTCNHATGICTCKKTASVAYTSADCGIPDPAFVFDPVEYYTREIMFMRPFFVNGAPLPQDPFLKNINASDRLHSSRLGMFLLLAAFLLH